MRSRHLVDPQLLPAVDGMPTMLFSLETLNSVRETVQAFAAGYVRPTDDGVTQEVVLVPGKNGNPDVRTLVYKPADHEPGALLPAVIYIHGGGFFSGSADLYEDWCRHLVRSLGIIVAAPDYRKAPENPYPAAIDDCYAVLAWLNQQAETLNIDPARIAVEGVSAGGALAASLCLLARDNREYSIAFQLLVYPMLDDRTGRGNTEQDPFGGEYIWTYEGNRFGWDTLLGKAAGSDGVSPYAAAARAPSLEGLPPTFVGVGALDSLMRENVEYAVRLIGSGVPTQLAVYPGAYHGFDAFDGGLSAVGEDFRTARVTAIRRALGIAQ